MFQRLKGIQVRLSDATTELFLKQEKNKTLEAQVAQLKRPLIERDASFALEINALRLTSDMHES